MRELIVVLRYREVLWNLVRRNLKIRYKNSILGFVWSLLNPLMQIGVWWFLFKVIWAERFGNQPNLMPVLLTGFLPWFFFSQTVLDSTGCVTQEMALVKKAYFPRSILPIASLISNLIHLGFAFIVLVILFAIWRVDINIHYLLIIPSTLLIAVFAYGLSAMTAAWSVFYTDVKFIVGNLLGLWFFLVPIIYPVQTVLAKESLLTKNWLTHLMNSWLPTIKQIFLLDPVTVGMMGYRSGLLYGGANMIADPNNPQLVQQFPIAHYIIAATIITIVVAIIGQTIFNRLSDTFAERG